MAIHPPEEYSHKFCAPCGKVVMFWLGHCVACLLKEDMRRKAIERVTDEIREQAPDVVHEDDDCGDQEADRNWPAA